MPCMKDPKVAELVAMYDQIVERGLQVPGKLHGQACFD